MFIINNGIQKDKARVRNIEVSFLWKSDEEKSFYVIDNHRCASWCWGQEVPVDSKYSIFHVDQHYDSLIFGDVTNMPKIDNHLSFEDYIEAEKEDGNLSFPVFQWDSYFSPFIEQRKDNFSELFLMTQKIGDKFQMGRELFPEDIKNCDFWFTNNERFIFNLDIDYFFMPSETKGMIRHLSDKYIEELARVWRKAQDSNRFFCTTIALSPCCCLSSTELEEENYEKGWNNSIEVLEIFCKEARIDIRELREITDT
jgi:hypothetical protein